MRQQQFIRFVQEICFLLKLSQPCSKTALQYFLKFKEYEHHSYDQEILIAACIYLSVKIFQEEVRIRDILNMIYVLTSLYKISAQQASKERQEKQQKSEQAKKKVKEDMQKEQMNVDKQPSQHKSHQQQQQPYILLKNIQYLQNLPSLIQPKYSLSDYNQYKGKIIQAEQMLLRILGFSFSLSQQNKKELKRLLIVIHHLRLPSTMAQTVIKVYNDIHYIDIAYWPEGVVYFSCLVSKILLQEKEVKREEKPQNNVQQITEELKEIKSKKNDEKELAQIKRVKEFTALMTAQKWEQLFSTTIKQLDNYAEKLTNFYTGIQIPS